jgi:hypothetical protein
MVPKFAQPQKHFDPLAHSRWLVSAVALRVMRLLKYHLRNLIHADTRRHAKRTSCVFVPFVDKTETGSRRVFWQSARCAYNTVILAAAIERCRFEPCECLLHLRGLFTQIMLLVTMQLYTLLNLCQIVLDLSACLLISQPHS